jgi:putative tricarboxylic transport membrane protein
MQTRPLVRADLITGVVLLAFGLAALAESWGMPRLEERNINPWTAPGIVPGMLGIIIAVLGAALAVRSFAAGALHARAAPPTADRAEARASFWRLAICAVLCFVYAVLMVGYIAFLPATGIFVFVFIAAFEWNPADTSAVRLRKLAAAAVIAAASAGVISYSFEKLFLVRLP